MPLFYINNTQVNVDERGSGPPLVLLHGFTGSAKSWADHTRVFGEHFTTYAVDLIGHGGSESPAASDRYRMERCVEDLIALLDQLKIESTALLAYSMGGRVALHLAVAAPERVRALVLESASPGVADPAERASRVKADEALAESIERDGLEAFIDRWESLPLFSSQRRLPADVQQHHRAQRLSNNALGLANSLRGMGAGAMEPVWDRLGELSMPIMLIAGELDEKYVELGTRMEIALPNARLLIAEDAGHTVHLEKPVLFNQAVRAWLKQVME